MASSSMQPCRVCGGKSFNTAHGLKVCNQCGRQEEHYVELVSQELKEDVNRSRLIMTRIKDPEDSTKQKDGPPPPSESNNWTTYEAYNYILYEWTKAMVGLGASPEFEGVVFHLWVAYLQRMGIAFVQTKRKYCRSSLKSTRDMKLLHEKAESVCSSSLHSYRHRRKKRKKKEKIKLTKLDKMKSQLAWQKLRYGQQSRTMNLSVAHRLSSSLNEFEASMLSDSSISFSSSSVGKAGKNTSMQSAASSFVEGSSFVASGSETEMGAQPHERKEQLRRDKVVRNWIKRRTHIYESDEEEDLIEEGEKGGKEEGTSVGKSSREICEEEEEDEDQDSEVEAERISSPEQGKISSKRPRKTHNIKKREYSKLHKKAVKDSGKVTPYRAAKLPFILNFSKLLGLLYLSVLLAEEDILLSDIIRWCREGHIPYFSAPYLLRPNMDVGYYDLFMLRNCKNLPNAQELQAIAGRLAVFLSVQYVPLPGMEGLVEKFVKTLNLPEEVTTVAKSLVGLVDDMKVELSVPPVESMAMAAIIMALKMFCGLDSHTEVMLSHGGDLIKTELPNCLLTTPFSWQDWQRHISRLVWVCCQVDPPTAFHWQQPHEIRHFSPEVFSKYFWSEGMWRIPRTSRKKKADMQVLIEELLEQQGLPLEEAIKQTPLFEPSRQPLRSTIEQLLQRDHAAESKEMQKYMKVAEELKKESFANHSIYWMDDMDHMASELQKRGSKTIPYLIRRKENVTLTSAGNPNIVHPKVEASGKESEQNAPHELLIPNPLTHYWMITKKKHDTWKKVSPSLPFSFRWLLGVGSNVCETSQLQILTLMCLLQGKIKPQKC